MPENRVTRSAYTFLFTSYLVNIHSFCAKKIIAWRPFGQSILVFQTIYCESCAILWCLPRQFLGFGRDRVVKANVFERTNKHFGVFSLLKLKCADVITDKYWKMGFVNVKLDHWALNIIEMKTKLGRGQGPFERFYYLNGCFWTLLLRF